MRVPECSKLTLLTLSFAVGAIFTLWKSLGRRRSTLRHDFGAFQAAGGDQKSTERTIYRCSLQVIDHEAHVGVSGPSIDVVVEGDGFLRYMVRIIAGTLLMVGMGLAPPETVLAALDDCDAEHGEKSGRRRRGIVGPTLPPERLCLEHVEYDQDHEKARV